MSTVFLFFPVHWPYILGTRWRCLANHSNDCSQLAFMSGHVGFTSKDEHVLDSLHTQGEYIFYRLFELLYHICVLLFWRVQHVCVCACVCVCFLYICPCEDQFEFQHFEDIFGKWGHLLFQRVVWGLRLDFRVKVSVRTGIRLVVVIVRGQDMRCSMCFSLSVLVLWTQFDSCTCWALDASLWVHSKFMTWRTHTCGNPHSLSLILSSHNHLRLLSLILSYFLVSICHQTRLPFYSFSLTHIPFLLLLVYLSFVFLGCANHQSVPSFLPILSESHFFFSLSFLSLLEKKD